MFITLYQRPSIVLRNKVDLFKIWIVTAGFKNVGSLGSNYDSYFKQLIYDVLIL